MNTAFYNQIAKSTAHRKSREYNKDFVFSQPALLEDLVAIAFNVNDKNHHKACWILELICEEKMELFIPFIEDFCSTLSKYKSDSAIRSISKICLFLSNAKKITLTETQEEKIIETCLDWLIQEEKVAAKAYAMRTLYFFGKKQNWIYTELQTILPQDSPNHSPAYKACAKDILRRIEKLSTSI